MVRSQLVSKMVDPDVVCGECGAVVMIRVWAIYADDQVDPVSQQTFRECTVDSDHAGQRSKRLMP